MKNLIRNGGFERNTTDFWTAYDEKSFTVVATPVHEGSYAGKLVCDGSNKPFIVTNDYIPVTVGETFYFEAWLRASGMYVAEICAVYYDEALNAIAEVLIDRSNPGTTSYSQKLWSISGVEGAVYVKPIICLDLTTLDEYMLIDGVMMYKFNPEEVIGGACLMIEEAGIHLAGSHFSDFFMVAPFKEAEFKLYVNDCAGAAETLDVKIVSRGNFGTCERDIATFEQVSAPDNLQTIVISEGLGTKIRVEAVVGGNPTDIGFYVVAIFKR
jgi:hypothetical protein